MLQVIEKRIAFFGIIVIGFMSLLPVEVRSAGKLVSLIKAGDKPFNIFGRAISSIRANFAGVTNILFIPLSGSDTKIMASWRDLAEGLREYFGKDAVVEAIIKDADLLLGALQVGYQQYIKRAITNPQLQKVGVYAARSSAYVPWGDVRLTSDLFLKEQELIRKTVTPAYDRLTARQNAIEGEFCMLQSCKDRRVILAHQNSEWLLIANTIFKALDDLRGHIVRL